MKDITVHTLGDIICEIDKIVRETNLRWWFRGHTDADWDLLPSVRRGYSRDQERYLSNEFRARAGTRHHKCPLDDEYAGWLAIMQHYRLPTRLLDWSRSPLVAAFFATESHQRHSDNPKDTDACIWALAPGRLNQSQGFEPLLYPLNANRLKDMIIPAIKGEDETDTVVAAMAVEIDLRMQVQQGAFTVHSSDDPLNQMAGCQDWLKKIVIPSKTLSPLARELDLAGFRLGDLFPDLDNLATELRGIHRPLT